MISIDRSIAPEIFPIEDIQWLPINEKKVGEIQVRGFHFEQGVFKLEVYFQKSVRNVKGALYSEIVEQWLKEGTAKLSGKEFFEQIDTLGGGLGIGSNNDFFVFSLSGLSRNFDALYQLLLEAILQPKLDATDFSRIVSAIKQKFQLALEKVEVLARRKTAEILYSDIPAYNERIELDQFEHLEMQEVRNYYQQTIASCPDIFLVGEPEIFDSIHWPQDTVSARSTGVNIVSSKGGDVVFVEKQDAVQNAIRLSKLTLSPAHPDFFPLAVGVTALGGYFESRLNKNLREDKGYTYGIHAGFQTMQYATFFGIITQVGSQHSQAALHEIEKELKNLQMHEMGEVELEDVKSYMAGSELRNADGPMNQLDSIKDQLLFNLPLSALQKKIINIKKVTAAQVQKAMITHLQWDSLVKVVVGKNG